jgi:hypothetical protein
MSSTDQAALFSAAPDDPVESAPEEAFDDSLFNPSEEAVSALSETFSEEGVSDFLISPL